jgi:hypothetical protein
MYSLCAHQENGKFMLIIHYVTPSARLNEEKNQR